MPLTDELASPATTHGVAATSSSSAARQSSSRGRAKCRYFSTKKGRFLRLVYAVLDQSCHLDLCGCFISTYDGYRSILTAMSMGYPCEIAHVIVGFYFCLASLVVCLKFMILAMEEFMYIAFCRDLLGRVVQYAICDY